ncbi:MULTISPECIES: substrate-binding domain-containing protein [unclassified Carboxylicivirga]|uniref:substrate-binding domain-containing protein n=1 Tax=Carboxylicivirga TaxID=1628153 RepID=UPI003D33E231
MSAIKNIFTILLVGLLLFGGCGRRKTKKVNHESTPPVELVIYCENTMLNMVVDLKERFEKEYNCTITLHNDCAKNLMGIIKYSARGDLYIPASAHSFQHFHNNTGYHLKDSLFLGYNHLVYMVKKGNPRGFDGHVSSLMQKGEYALMMANAETSALGYETKAFLEYQGAYAEVLQSVVSLTSDAKGLAEGLQGNQADVAINWGSNIYVNGNRNYIDVVRPQTAYQTAIPMYAAVLSCTTQANLARSFLDMAANELNESFLSRYGFSKRATIIF